MPARSTLASDGAHAARHAPGTSPSNAFCPKSRWYRPFAPLCGTYGFPAAAAHASTAFASQSDQSDSAEPESAFGGGPAPGHGILPLNPFPDALNDLIDDEYISTSSTFPVSALPSRLTSSSFGSFPASPGGKSPARPFSVTLNPSTSPSASHVSPGISSHALDVCHVDFQPPGIQSQCGIWRVGVLVGQVFVRRPIRWRQPTRARRVVHLLDRVQLCTHDRLPRRLHANDHAPLHRVVRLPRAERHVQLARFGRQDLSRTFGTRGSSGTRPCRRPSARRYATRWARPGSTASPRTSRS